jgi:hypothetical protein
VRARPRRVRRPSPKRPGPSPPVEPRAVPRDSQSWVSGERSEPLSGVAAVLCSGRRAGAGSEASRSSSRGVRSGGRRPGARRGWRRARARWPSLHPPSRAVAAGRSRFDACLLAWVRWRGQGRRVGSSRPYAGALERAPGRCLARRSSGGEVDALEVMGEPGPLSPRVARFPSGRSAARAGDLADDLALKDARVNADAPNGARASRVGRGLALLWRERPAALGARGSSSPSEAGSSYSSQRGEIRGAPDDFSGAPGE